MKLPYRNLVFRQISSVKPSTRRILLVLTDAGIIPFVIWFGFWVKHEIPFSEEFLSSIWLIYASIFIGIPLYLLTGQYKSLTRYVGSKSLYFLISRNALLILILIILGKFFNLLLPSNINLLLFWILVSVISGGMRFILRDMLTYLAERKVNSVTKVGIYGAGSFGAQLEAA